MAARERNGIFDPIRSADTLMKTIEDKARVAEAALALADRLHG